MSLSKWYIITPECNYGMQDLKDIHEVYIARRILPVGCMVPLEWKGKQLVQDIYLPANYLQAYEPTEDDWPILYALWSHLRPLNFKGVFVENHRLQDHAFYRICEPDEKRNMSSVPYAYAALCDVEGVCKAGDFARSGDIVPAKFFTGLSAEQMERLEAIGLCSETWLNQWPKEYRVGYWRTLARPVIEPYHPNKSERETLFEKYPQLAPKQESPSTTRKRKV